MLCQFLFPISEDIDNNTYHLHLWAHLMLRCTSASLQCKPVVIETKPDLNCHQKGAESDTKEGKVLPWLCLAILLLLLLVGDVETESGETEAKCKS